MVDIDFSNRNFTKNSNSVEGMILFSNILNDDCKILDIGSGKHESHANFFRDNGFVVDTCDFHKNATYKGNFNDLDIHKSYNGIWTAHCLEHQLNVNLFLKKIYSVLLDDGILCITVPVFKQNIVSGHYTFWNAGLLLYNLVMAGFDCSNAKIKTYGYNISVIVKKKSFIMPQLKYDKPDLVTLQKYFPDGLEWLDGKGFEGEIEELDWNPNWKTYKS